MNQPNSQNRTFIQLSKAWYGKAASLPNILDDIKLGIEGTNEELHIEWVSVGERWAARIAGFDDSYSTFLEFTDLIEALAKLNGLYQTPDQVAALIEGLGIKNITPTNQ